MAKKEKEVAALAAVIAFFIMHASNWGTDHHAGGADTMPSGSGHRCMWYHIPSDGRGLAGIIVGLGCCGTAQLLLQD